MPTFTHRAPTPDDFDALAALRVQHAAADAHDPLSTMESLPTAAALRDVAAKSSCSVVVEVNDERSGYGLVRWWDEETGPRLVLCDWYLAPAHAALHAPLLATLEGEAAALELAPADRARAVLGANASSVQPERCAAIDAAGYRETFTQVEMETTDLALPPAPLPPALTLRHATLDDADALVALTTRVWAGREFFAMPTVARIADWLRRSDLSMFDLAWHDDELVAFVASIPAGPVAEIDDVQVDPRYQRQGIARALITRNLAALAARGVTTVRLNTEGHDPTGARSLYERLGFRVVRSYVRFRKPLT